MLKEKNIVLGVTAGIAAYKAVEIASRLRKAGAEVHTVMTEEAVRFVAPLTFREITGHPVAVSMWNEVMEFKVEHISLATLADAVLIAPATANIIGKIACGIADDLLTTTIMATKAPVFPAPAMNCNMYENPIVQENLARLAKLGYPILPPDEGPLACGVSGKGRLPAPEKIVAALAAHFAAGGALTGKRVLVTAAGTVEPIDPVRYIGNRSSGKMGYAIAAEAQRRGAAVTLVSGPSALEAPAGVRLVKVESARQMQDAVLEAFPETDITVKAAAVADYRVQCVAENKIKKSDETLTLVLEKNPDILQELGRRKRADQFLVGFAAETQNLLAYAEEKLRRKNLDMIVANDVSQAGSGFDADTNRVKLLYRDGRREELPCMPKSEVAAVLWDRILANAKN